MDQSNKIPHDIKFGAKDPFGLGLDIEIMTGRTSPKAIWDMKDQLTSYITNSRKIWDSMAETEREALIRIVRTFLERMYDGVEDWVPESLTKHSGGDFMEAHMRIIFTDLKYEIDRYEAVSDFQIQRAALEALEMASGE